MKHFSRIRARWVIGLLAGTSLLFCSMSVFAKVPSAGHNDDFYREIELLEEALSRIRAEYVEQPEAKPLIYGAMRGMLATLDPYSQFLDPDSYNELKVDTEGEFGGLGIEITIKDELLTIITPIDDTPAYRAGLLSGDRIVKIDGELTRGITLIEAVKKLRGKPKTQVNLTILREQDATAELKEVTLERDVIKIDSVKEARILEDHVGYIRLTDFREKTSPDLEKALRRLVEDQMDALILDLRNNPGGLLDTAVSVAELFLDRNQVIVTTRGRNKSQNQDFRARRDGMIHSMPLVVLINEGSASASEIVAGAVQDHGRGIIMGIKSHGKASVQTIFPLKDGSALRLTTSKYFTPKGRSIHGSGIVPDVEIPLEKPAVKAEEQDKTQRGEEVFEQLEKKDGAAQPDAKKPEWDNQLHRALDLLKALKVYQGREKHKVVSRVPYDDSYSRY